MIELTETLKKMADFIGKKPNCRLGDVAASMGQQSNNASSLMTKLVESGAVARSGKRGSYTYILSGKPYYAKESRVTLKKMPSVHEPPDESLLNELKEFELSEEQEIYLRGHTHLPRQVLAKRLGINKLELNQFMDKKGIKSTFMPKDIDTAEDA